MRPGPKVLAESPRVAVRKARLLSANETKQPRGRPALCLELSACLGAGRHRGLLAEPAQCLPADAGCVPGVRVDGGPAVSLIRVR